MNINTNIYKQYIKPGTSQSHRSFSFNAKAPVSVSKTDSLSMGSEASMFRTCSRAIKGAVSEIVSPAEETRINSLKKQISDGTYYVSSEKVADAILERIV